MPAATPEQAREARKKIIIVDDHPVLRRGLAALIESEPDLAVCATAATCQAALEAIRETRPDLVIVDLALQEGDGLDLLKEMKAHHPEIPSLVLSMHHESVYAERSLRAGARGYISKQVLDETVVAAIRHVLGGGTYMSTALAERLATQFVGGRAREPGLPLARLSNRQLQVFRLLGQGLGTRQIAERLCLSVKTVESHMEHIKNKLTISSATELAHQATVWVETGDGT